MARFDTNGLDALVLDLDEINEIDDGTMQEMLEAGGEVIRKAHVESIKKLFTRRSGKLEGSPIVHKKMGGCGNLRYILVYPAGEHHTYRARGKTYTKMNWGRKGTTVKKAGGTKKATNQDVAFVHEFGGHGNAAEQWMRKANEEHATEATDAEAAVFYDWQKSHNL
jgi:hypothetical protein